MPVTNPNKPYSYNVPSESAFNHQLTIMRDTLDKLKVIIPLDITASTQAAIEELTSATADMWRFNPYYIDDPRFFKLPTEIFDFLEDFHLKNPTIKKGTEHKKLQHLIDKKKSMAVAAARKGIVFSSLSTLSTR